MKPGVYSNISNDDYHASDGVSKSGLSLILKSPAHYAARYIHGEPEEPTPAMEFGTAFHAAVLEPYMFASDWAVQPDVNRRTKAGKEKWEKFLSENEGKHLLKHDDMTTIENMREAVLSHPAASRLLTGGSPELSIYWNDRAYNVLCKCRPDYLLADSMIAVDLKTCVDASYDGFSKACANFGYHIQAAFYMDGISSIFERQCKAFVFIAVEKKPPYAVAVYTLDRESVDYGRMEYREAIARYAECLRNNTWPGYDSQVKEISLPRWAVK